MIFEPESWTGLRSSEAVTHGIGHADDDASAPAPAKGRIGALVDRMVGRAPAGEAPVPDFLRKRRVIAGE